MLPLNCDECGAFNLSVRQVDAPLDAPDHAVWYDIFCRDCGYEYEDYEEV